MATREKEKEGGEEAGTTLKGDKVQTSAQVTHESPLLQLPAELRNIVYRYVLGGMIVRAEQPYNSSRRNVTVEIKEQGATDTASWRRPSEFLALTRTCRQVHEETALLPFIFNHFEFNNYHAYEFFISLLSSEQRDAVVAIQIPLWTESVVATSLDQETLKRLTLLDADWALEAMLEMLGNVELVIFELEIDLKDHVPEDKVRLQELSKEVVNQARRGLAEKGRDTVKVLYEQKMC